MDLIREDIRLQKKVEVRRARRLFGLLNNVR